MFNSFPFGTSLNPRIKIFHNLRIGLLSPKAYIIQFSTIPQTTPPMNLIKCFVDDTFPIEAQLTLNILIYQMPISLNEILKETIIMIDEPVGYQILNFPPLEACFHL